MNLYKGIMLLITIWAMISAHDGHTREIQMPNNKTIKAIYYAAKTFNVDAQSLIKIAYMESHFKPQATRYNKNGTIDYGMFQINSVHWTTTCRKYNIFQLKGNAYCAAKLMSEAQKYKNVDAHWVGRYHSKTPSKKMFYARQIASIQLH